MALAIAVKVSYASQGEIRFDNPSQIQIAESLSIDSPAIPFIARWIPGTNNGEPVRSYMVIPFVFKLNNNNDKGE